MAWVGAGSAVVRGDRSAPVHHSASIRTPSLDCTEMHNPWYFSTYGR